MNRRTVLKSLSTATAVGIAGCQGDRSGQGEPRSSSTSTPTEVQTESSEQKKTETTQTEQETDEPNQSTHYVAPDGDDSNSGSREEPLASVHEALTRVGPAERITVAPGEYFEEHEPGEPLRTIRGGEPGAPITITGPETAVVRPGIRIKHSHVRLEGLTFEALLDPSNPDDPASYFDYPVGIRPMPGSDDYVEDIVCAPAAVGYSAYALIRVVRAKDIEIGPTRITGLAGASWILSEEPGRHAGEIIYLGSPPGMVFDTIDPKVDYPWEGEIDQTRNVHIHHIDNSAGHPHSELVDAKVGTQDILVEYCTDGGGSQNTEDYQPASIRLGSFDATIRWCKLHDGSGDGIQINTGNRYLFQDVDVSSIGPSDIGTGIEIYGNRVTGFENADLMLRTGHPDPNERRFDPIGPADLRKLCGNVIPNVFTEQLDYTAKKRVNIEQPTCSDDTPEGDDIGHTGGESPWS
ncbi:right-handed parallel beta-helix repeat-containing protein [Halobaculum rarum]|uniref:right-handed parallel beta-helix repeat-containing protein n=1 Tax=Halobaculum rarum TaxID=3075122 RepID=UPI0032AF2406